MAQDYAWVSFDCYGTLVDWESGIATAFAAAAAAARRGRDLDRRELLAAYHEVEPAVQAERYRSYREVLSETACRVARRFAWELSAEQAEFLPRSIGDWPPFPDTRPALGRLRTAGLRLGVLSNVDRDLLALTLRGLVPFDLVVTAEDVRAYKPAAAHFVEARRVIGDRPWLHAAQSLFHDVVPANRLGIPVVWINRTGERPRPEARPDREFSTLAELADWLV